MRPADFFADAKHEPFLLQGGSPAALMIHGFPGTPAELRPLAGALNRQGWTVQGILLPGLGADLNTLPSRRASDWVETAGEALDLLLAQHRPVALFGYSMGAAVALNAGASRPADAMILAAPFWRLGSWRERLIWKLTRPMMKDLRPFASVDFSDSSVKDQISQFLPGVNLEDPEAQEMLRELSLPVRVLDEIEALGGSAFRRAKEVTAPSLVLQGDEDPVVTPDRTRRLVAQFGGPVYFETLPAGHGLLDTEQPAWSKLVRSVEAFASTLVEASLP